MASGFLFMSDRVPFKPDEEPESKPQEIEPNRVEGMSFLEHTGYHRMSDFLEVGDDERRDPKVAEKISYIVDWAKEETGKDDEIEHMNKIRELMRDLGVTYKGKDLISILYRYTRLLTEKMEVNKELKLFKPIGGKNG